jgi:transposase
VAKTRTEKESRKGNVTDDEWTEIDNMEPVLYCCAGLDIHRDTIEACIVRGQTGKPQAKRGSFGTMPADLQELVKWLSSEGCYNVAMESTGVYWKPVFEAIEVLSEYAEKIWVVNPQHMKNLPGRKSDVKDAEWIARMLKVGLLEKSFVPEIAIRDLREFSRLHRTFVQEKARYINRTEKFLQAHGFKFSSVMKDIFSSSGRRLMNILRDNGEITEADVFANCTRLHTPLPDIAKAVCGKINNAEQRLLKQLLHKIDSCQEDIDSIFKEMLALTQSFQEQVDIIDSIPGFDVESAIEIIAEISASPQEHFSSGEKLCGWAGVRPRNDESAETIKSKKILKGNKYIKSILCQAAWAAVKVRGSPFHSWFWSHQGKLGRKKAIIAVARKLLMLIYLLLSTGQKYQPPEKKAA